MKDLDYNNNEKLCEKSLVYSYAQEVRQGHLRAKFPRNNVNSD
jgi:hypothetical protein